MFWLLPTVLVELAGEEGVVCLGNSPPCSVWQAVGLWRGSLSEEESTPAGTAQK